MSPQAHPLGFQLSVLRELIYRYHQVNPCAHSIPQISRYFSEIAWDENSSVPYSKLKMLDSDEKYTLFNHLPRSTTTLNVLSWKICNLLFILFIITKFLFYANFQVPTSSSRTILKDPYSRNFTNINTYFYNIFQYSTYSQRQGSVGYTNKYSILVSRKIPSSKYQTIFPGQFPAQSFPAIFLHCLS